MTASPTHPPTPSSARCASTCAAQSLARWRHALRGPLNAILAATAVLEACPPDSVAALQARRIIAQQTRNLAWLISDLPADEHAAG